MSLGQMIDINAEFRWIFFDHVILSAILMSTICEIKKSLKLGKSFMSGELRGKKKNISID